MSPVPIALLLSRYAFAALGLFIAAGLAARAVSDLRRAAALEKSRAKNAPFGYLSVIGGGTRRTRNAAFALMRENVVGRGHSCDIRLPGKGVRKRHALAVIGEGELLITPISDSPALKDGRETKGTFSLRSGETVTLGGVTLSLTLRKPA